MTYIYAVILMGQNLSYRTTLILGLFVFLFLGLSGSAVFYTSMCMMKTKKYLARTVGISYMFGILLQFVNNNLVNQEVAEAVILSVFILILAFLLVRNGQQEDGSVPFPVTDSSRNQKNSERTAAGILLILLVVLMTCIFSTLDNAVTLVHAFGTVDIGQWPRILLACSGLAAGFVFDIRNRRFMCLIMYCVMMLSTICIAIQKCGGSFLSGLFVFYLSAGFLQCSSPPVLWSYPII